MSPSINPSVFRDYDIRGISFLDLSNTFAESLGLAYAELLRGRTPAHKRKKLTITVGKDCRLSSASYEDSLIKGLLAGGVDVIRLGLCATPVLYFSIYHLNLDGGIMVTGSHNPPDYNGFKICVGKDTICANKIQVLRTMIENRPHPINGKGRQSDFAINPVYLKYLLKKFRKLKKEVQAKRVVIDCANGMASMVAPQILRALGIEVFELNCQLDGTFPNHFPDPTIRSNLVDLEKEVKKHSADFGVSYDGDGDRLGVVSSDGHSVPGDDLMFIFSQALLKDKPDSTIVSEVSASSHLIKQIKKMGGIHYMSKVGHSHLKAKMKETGALLGGGLSGHFCFRNRYFGFDDAIYATLRLLEITSGSKEKLTQLLNEIPLSFSTPVIHIPFEDQIKFKLVKRAAEAFRKDLNLREFLFTEIDGIRIDFKDGWGLLRASNTQPSINLRFEAQTEKRLSEIKLIFENTINQVCQIMFHSPIRL